MTDKTAYRKLEALNYSALKQFEKSPAHFRYYMDYPEAREDTVATLTGSAWHYLTIDEANFNKHMVVLNEAERPEPSKNYQTKVNQVWKADKIAEAARAGLQIISSDDLGIAQDMAEELWKDHQARELIKAAGVIPEMVSTWTRDGIKFKCMRDIWHPEYCLDLKSCQSADPTDFERDIFKMDYHLQGGLYSDPDRVLNDTQFFNPYFIVAQEKTAPYGVSVHLLSDEVLEYGFKKMLKLAKGVKKCEETGIWPGYSSKYSDYNTVNLPEWLNR